MKTLMRTVFAFAFAVMSSFEVQASTKYKVTCSVNGGGAVSGTGKYKKGETVTLTAKAKSGWVFSGYWALPTCIDCGPGKTVKMSGNTYSFKMAAMDAPVGATFVRKSDDQISEFDGDSVWRIWRYDGAQNFWFGEVESESKPSYSASGLPKGIVKSGHFLKCAKPTSVKPGIYTVTLTAKNRSGRKATKKIKIYVGNKEAEGVFPELNTGFDGYECQVGIPLGANSFSVYPISGWKTSASGLPPGVKWNASKGCFSGVPTKKGTYVVTLKGVKGKTSKTATAFFFVRALPSSVVGTFNGYATDGEYGFDSRSKIVKVTVSSVGKISVKIGSTTYSRTGFSSRNGSVYAATLSKKEKITSGCGKGGYKVWTINVRIDADADWRANQLQGYYSYMPDPCRIGAYYELHAQRNPFGKDSKGKYLNAEAGQIVKKYAALKNVGMLVFPGSVSGVYDLVCKGCIVAQGAKPTLFAKVSSSGAVTLTGKIGGKTVSGSAPLILDWGDRYENEARTRFIVKSSDGKKTFAIQLEYSTYRDWEHAYEPNGFAVQSGKLNDCGEAISLDNPYDSDCDEDDW